MESQTDILGKALDNQITDLQFQKEQLQGQLKEQMNINKSLNEELNEKSSEQLKQIE